MIVLIILAVIIFLLVLTLNIPVSAYIRYYDGNPDIKVSFLFAQLYPARPKKEKKKKPHKKHKRGKKSISEEESSSKQKNFSAAPEASPESGSGSEKEESADIPQKAAADTEGGKNEKNPRQNPLEKLSALIDGLTEKKNSVQLLTELIMDPLKRLGGKLRIDDLKIDFAAADDDACNAALLYGKVNAAVYNTLSAVRCFVPVSVTGIRIDCLFNTPAEKCRWDGEFKIKLRPASLVNALLAVAFGYIKEKEKYAPVMALFGKN